VFDCRRLGHEADYSLYLVKTLRIHGAKPTSTYVFKSCSLNKHRDNFTLIQIVFSALIPVTSALNGIQFTI
jgi:hypothetical protein